MVESDNGGVGSSTENSTERQMAGKNAGPSSSEDSTERQKAENNAWPPPSPEPYANPISKLLLLWVAPLVWKGFKKPLTEDDVWDLNPKDKAGVTSKRFNDLYDSLVPGPGRLTWTLWRMNCILFFITAALQLGVIAMTVASPLIVDKILINVSDSDSPRGPGYGWSVGLFLSSVLRTLFETHYYVEIFRATVKVRAALQAVIYRKAIRLSSSSRGGSSVGEITNLMQLDTETIGRLVMTIQSLWSAPVQLVVSMVLLYVYIGPSALIGLAFTLMTVPLQSWVIKRLFALRRKTMRVTDQRVKLTNEILQGIRAVKFYAWEKPFFNKVGEPRKEELSYLQRSIIYRATFVVILTALPNIVSIVTYTFYLSVFKNPFNVADIFTGLILLNQLRQPLLALPFAITSIIEAKVSLKRIGHFLNFPDRPPVDPADPNCKRGEIRMTDASFSWGEAPAKLPTRKNKSKSHPLFYRLKNKIMRKETVTENAKTVDDIVGPAPPVLQDATVDFKPRKLTVIVGRVGSGKTSLLNALLGEMKNLDGVVQRNGSVGFVPQTAWIYNGTVKDNIVFGNVYDQDRYDRAIDVSCLQADVDILPNGHDTVIGEKGVNLSGGQKQRVSIARTVYNDSDIYIFDDPLSALDSHVGREVFDKCMSRSGILRKKTRILVTNQLQVLPETDHIVFISGGRIRNQGTFQEMRAKDPEFKQLLEEIVSSNDDDDKSRYTVAESSVVSETADANHPAETATGDEKRRNIVSKNILMSVEDRQIGHVKTNVYWHYARLCGGVFLFSWVIFTAVLTAVAQVLPNWWLSYWSEQQIIAPTARSNSFYLGIFYMMGIAYVLFVFIRSMLYFSLALVGSRKLHARALTRTLGAPISFFEVTPSGRILSRFSRDVINVDQQVPTSFMQLLNTLLSLIGAYVMIAVVTPLFIAVAVPIAVMYYLLQRFYNRTNIEVKRLDSISKSPIYAHFSETLSGLTTIRAFQKQDTFMEDNKLHIDTNVRFFFAQNVTNRWFTLWLEWLGAILILAAALFGVLGKGHIFSGLVGLSLNYSLQVTSFLGFTIRSITELEAQMNSVERLCYYAESLPQEDKDGVDVPDNWPSEGALSMNNVTLSYRDGLELALKGVTCSIKAQHKVGIVGRTGAGKSSLIVAMLRIVDNTTGELDIDGIDTRTVRLEDLRSRVTIIPQDPVVFSGPLRFNLDPFSMHTDEEMWDALEKSSLKDFVASTDNGLDMSVSEYGENMSAGQRQLLCLARALLRHPKVLIMDEATSNVDYETDQIVQRTIREQFQDSTILTIAHRLWTIADYDLIMVVDEGRVAELDSPANLLAIPDSKLSSLVDAMGAAGAASFREGVRRGLATNGF